MYGVSTLNLSHYELGLSLNSEYSKQNFTDRKFPVFRGFTIYYLKYWVFLKTVIDIVLENI